MEQVRLGRTGLQVSSVAFGGIPIQRLSEADAIRVVQRCMDLGVTLIDTAHGYGNSEERIGKAIQGRREDLVLATKSHASDGPTFRAEMEQSFSRLMVEHIDVFQFHNVTGPEQLDRIMAPGGPMEVLQEAKAAGRVGHIGVTSHRLDYAQELVKTDLFETMMFPFNFITREPADELLPLCNKHDVALIAMKPMGGGLLESAELAFKWLKQYPSVLPVVGIQTLDEIEEIVAIMQDATPLSAVQQQHIQALRDELGTRFCRGCGYCLPCRQDIDLPSVMRAKSSAKRFPAERFWGPEMHAQMAKIATCVECGDCESRCPYELSIRQVIKENLAWYESQFALRGS